MSNAHMYSACVECGPQYIPYPVFSPAKIEGVGERHILGGASVHIKAFGSTPIPLQRQISTEGIGGPYPLSMLGRTLLSALIMLHF